MHWWFPHRSASPEEPTMTPISDTVLAPLEAEGRLFNPVFKGPLASAGRFGFRGELALKFTPNLEKEARPPELVCQQVLTVADSSKKELPFFAGYLLSFGDLKTLTEVLGSALGASGKYFAYCNNIDLGTRYQVTYGGVTWYVLPIDEGTVYNEMLELLKIDKNNLKKLDTAGKLDAVARAAVTYKGKFDTMTNEQGLERMGPVRDPAANRPV
jgi:hypothetical protein